MKIEVLVKVVGKRFVVVSIDVVKDSPVDLAEVFQRRSEALRYRNDRAEYWSDQYGVKSVYSAPFPVSNQG